MNEMSDSNVSLLHRATIDIATNVIDAHLRMEMDIYIYIYIYMNNV
jgi:hypothetical protein